MVVGGAEGAAGRTLFLVTTLLGGAALATAAPALVYWDEHRTADDAAAAVDPVPASGDAEDPADDPLTPQSTTPASTPAPDASPTTDPAPVAPAVAAASNAAVPEVQQGTSSPAAGGESDVGTADGGASPGSPAPDETPTPEDAAPDAEPPAEDEDTLEYKAQPDDEDEGDLPVEEPEVDDPDVGEEEEEFEFFGYNHSGPTPDLTVTSLTVVDRAPSADSPFKNKIARIVIANVGEGDSDWAEVGAVAYTVSDGAWRELGWTYLFDLAPGATTTVEMPWSDLGMVGDMIVMAGAFNWDDENWDNDIAVIERSSLPTSSGQGHTVSHIEYCTKEAPFCVGIRTDFDSVDAMAGVGAAVGFAYGYGSVPLGSDEWTDVYAATFTPAGGAYAYYYRSGDGGYSGGEVCSFGPAGYQCTPLG